MFEKVNPSHPDKVADRIAGALVDMAYAAERDPRIAVEVLVGHGSCLMIAETSVPLDKEAVKDAAHRIGGATLSVGYREFPQDAHLADNQAGRVRCGDNGIFRGCPVTDEQRNLSTLMRDLWHGGWATDGKAVCDGSRLTLCQSNADEADLLPMLVDWDATVNPLGRWTGGTNVDTGATNRKLGSDMGDAITGGGLHGKDLSKADVSVNVMCHLLAQETGCEVTATCSIGDEEVTFWLDWNYDCKTMPYEDVVARAREHILTVGGFERFAEWGLV